MRNIRSFDMLFLDNFFAVGNGYVLTFSNSTFSRFFADELNVDIDDPCMPKTARPRAGAYAVSCRRPMCRLWSRRSRPYGNTVKPSGCAKARPSG